MQPLTAMLARMPVAVDAIVHSLAPGIALTSGIFFANGLQTRYSLVTTRVRALNAEARALKPDEAARRKSLRWQVALLTRRTRVTHKAILTAYAGLLAYTATIVLLLASTFLALPYLTLLTYLLFGTGLACVGFAMLLSLSELRLSHDTLVEDVRSSFGEEENAEV